MVLCMLSQPTTGPAPQPFILYSTDWAIYRGSSDQSECAECCQLHYVVHTPFWQCRA